MSDPYPVTTVDLLRHGACEGGAMVRGTTNSPLSKPGWQQMDNALKGLRGWQRLISSPLLRCRAFAEYFASIHNLPLTIIDDLREMDFGAWEGLTPEEAERRNPALMDAYSRNPEHNTPPDGESLASGRQRIAAAWEQLLADYSGEHWLMILHGGTIRLLLCHLLAAPLNSSRFFHIPYGGLTRLRICHTPQGFFPQLVFHRPEPAE